MKKLLLFVMFVTLLSFSALGESFRGTGDGYLGDIVVEVEVKDTTLTDISVVEHSDTPRIAESAFKKIGSEMIEKQSLDIDSMAGATYSSEGFIDAVKKAVDASGISLKSKKQAVKELSIADVNTDIVVIGGGGAGLTAAIEAREKGADVILLEKMPILGGNTTYATGGLNAADTIHQNNGDTTEIFYNDTMKGGRNINDESLVMTLVNNSSDVVKWLSARGADLTDVGRMGGASVDRTHRPNGGDKVGPNIVDALSARAEEIGVDIRLLTSAVDITASDNKVDGVIVENGENTYRINARAIVLATGGFGNSSEKFETLNPALKGFGTTNHPGATGDALDLVADLNVATVDMKEIQTHPTVVPVRNTMITEAVRGNGAILVNRSGKRFVNELSTRDVVSEATLEQKGKTAFLLFDQNVRESLKAIEGYAKMGILTEAASLNELAAKIGVPVKNLKATFKKYNNFVTSEKDKEFARQDMATTLVKGPFYAVEVGPAVHHTMGGVKIDSNTQVYNNSGVVVDGLFAAGEVTGGVHGANRLGGNALTDITVFGRIAGDAAAAYVK